MAPADPPQMLHLLRYVRFPLICCLVGVTAVFVSHGGFTAPGIQAAWITLVLLALGDSLRHNRRQVV